MYGQHWLKDETVLNKIIQAAEIKKGEPVLEVGPGLGVLTEKLVTAGARVTAIENDPELWPVLEEKFGSFITLIKGDALAFDFSKIFSSGSYKLVANIPYNITSPLLQKFLSNAPQPKRLVLMVQREVADRLMAKPPEMSLLSVMAQVYATIQKVTNVPKGAFQPPPRVDSAVIVLDTKPQAEQEQVIAMAKAGFSAKRRQLHHNLSAAGYGEASEIKKTLEKLGLSTTIRAENLTIGEWKRLVEAVIPRSHTTRNLR